MLQQRAGGGCSSVHRLPACLQTFFKFGFLDQTQHTSYFEDKTKRLLLKKHLVKQDVEAMPVQTAKLTWDVFAVVRDSLRPMLQNSRQFCHPLPVVNTLRLALLQVNRRRQASNGAVHAN